jgi:hypothetical protein
MRPKKHLARCLVLHVQQTLPPLPPLWTLEVFACHPPFSILPHASAQGHAYATAYTISLIMCHKPFLLTRHSLRAHFVIQQA